jgi:hypothetical protein
MGHICDVINLHFNENIQKSKTAIDSNYNDLKFVSMVSSSYLCEKRGIRTNFFHSTLSEGQEIHRK